jgi:hypothetical protein
MKIAFVDIDEVLNSTQHPGEAYDSPDSSPLDPFHIKPLNDIVEQTGALVVLSTSWRTDIPSTPSGLWLCPKNSG